MLYLIRKRLAWSAAVCLLLGTIAIGMLRTLVQPARGEPILEPVAEPGQRLAPETAAAHDPNWERAYPQYQPLCKVL